jgi:hypothetical protein
VRIASPRAWSSLTRTKVLLTVLSSYPLWEPAGTCRRSHDPVCRHDHQTERVPGWTGTQD